MENIVNHVERFRNFIKRWWITLILGVAILALGVLVFVRPAEPYVTLSVAFGIVILATGISDIFIGAEAPARTGRGWEIAAGVLEALLGIFVLCKPAVLVALLPFMLGFWIMFRGFTMIGVASDMMDYRIKGA